jgi:D-aminopeptidase
LKSALARTEPSIDRARAVVFDEKKIDAIFAHLNQCQLPGATVGIAIGGKPVYRRGFGLANMELPVVLSPTIRMRIGSTTKHFTCLAYLLLCEEGKARIDDPVGKFLPELNPVAHRVTLRQLMANTSGLIDPHDVCFQFSGLGASVKSDALVAHFRDIDCTNAPPGTAWNYNNGGFELVRAVIERISGQSLAEFMRDHIFEPIGMHDTLMCSCTYADFVPNRATAHMVSKTGRFEKWDWMEHIGSGGIVSTTDDMLRWLAHMDRPVIGSAASWSAIKTAQTLINGTSTNYGFGLISDRYRGVETLYHAGGGLGSGAQMVKVPAASLDVMVMMNRGDLTASSLANKVLDACLPDLDPIKASQTEPFATGTFHSPLTHRVIQLFSRDNQQFVSIGGLDLPFEPDGAGTLWPTPKAMGFAKQGVKLIGDASHPSAIQFSNFGNLDELVRVPPASKPDVKAIAGRYRSESTDSEASILETPEGPRMQTRGRFGAVLYDLEPLGEGIWRARTPHAITPPGGVLAMNGDGSGFHFSTWQTWALPFRRCG